MKLRSKILAVVVPIMLVSIFIMNFVFWLFFNSYLEEQENAQIASTGNGINTFLGDMLDDQQGNANDWAHWDDTYSFVNGESPLYPVLNLNADTFVNLNADFIIYVVDNSIYYKQYFDIERMKPGEFSAAFDTDFLRVTEAAGRADDVSGIYKLDDGFYLVSASDITDSLKKEKPVGKFIIGQRIDGGMLKDIGKIAQGSVVSVEAVSDGSAETSGDYVFGIARDGENVKFQCLIPPRVYNGSPIKFVIEKKRSFYTAGMNEFTRFQFIDVLFSVTMAVLLFTILTFYLSKPFVKLIKELKCVDLKAIRKIEAKGKGEFLYLRTAINNMLEELETEQIKVKDKEEKLYATLKSVGDGVVSVNREGNVQFMNPAAQELSGWTMNEALDLPLSEILCLRNEYTGEYLSCTPADDVFRTESVVELSNHTVLISKDGTERPIEDTAAPIRDKSGSIVGCVIVFRDFSERKEKQKRIEYLSYHDQLTGLYNRRYFEDELKRLDTRKNLPISLIYADVNGLKTINDAFGHQTGDKLIQQAARVLKDECRSRYIISRTGGDEFIILLTKTDRDSAEQLVTRLRKKMEKQSIMGIDISLSFGWDTKESEDESVWEALKNAEDSMYQKKILSSSSKRSAVIGSILDALHLMCPPEEAHSKRVGALCESIGKAYGLNVDELKELRLAGELHDIGKIAVDKAVLNKEKKLTESEWAHIKTHTETGFRILSTSREYYRIAEYVLAHHERWDGGGYPKGLKGEEINWKARIITVADAYDAMTSSRPYSEAVTREQAVEEIRANAGKQFDPDIAKVFIEKVLKEK